MLPDTEYTPEEQEKLLDRVAEQVVRRRLEMPAAMFLEMHRPLRFFAGQGLLLASPLLGALFGLVHGGVALTALIPLFAGISPRIGSLRGGLESRAVLEPPGLFALNYGAATPLVATGAHVVYGAVLGLFLGSA